MINPIDNIHHFHSVKVTYMCGIIGAVAKRDVAELLLEGLDRLEYRGYDSAGIAIVNSDQQLTRIRTLGKVDDLAKLVNNAILPGHTGIAHTRWATHGKPSEINAHPHIAGNEIAIVHNGIIENHTELRRDLIAKGCIITSETDSELIAHIIYLQLCDGKDLLTSIQHLTNILQGAYAIGIICKSEPGRLLALRKGSPLVIGLAENETFVCSDTQGLGLFATSVIYLDDGDIADIQNEKLNLYDQHGNSVTRLTHKIDKNMSIMDKGEYSHYMLKEIFEQRGAISRTLQDRCSSEHIFVEAFGEQAPAIFTKIRKIQIVACGTSYHAGLVAKYWIEEIARIPVQVEIASEFRYKTQIIEPETLFITLSQSGETADTLAALRLAKESGYVSTLTICNVPDSSIVRESALVLLLDAGPEISVASTKAFTCQLTALFMLAIALGKCKDRLPNSESHLVSLLTSIPSQVEQTLKLNDIIQSVSKKFIDKHNALFVARGILFPIALEGALKLKEISYIHAEGYPAGELKHGPLALVNNDNPIIALAPNDNLIDKLKSNIEEIQARKGEVLIFADTDTDISENDGMKIIRVPSVHRYLSPIIYSIPMQLLAYHVAVIKGTNIDQPRNLAKSVTVE